jgi:histidinol-phosphate/aromatic aminotransferase/cobyric acid decarboxylase-like protein
MKPQDLQTLARAALMPTTAPATPAPTAAQAIAAKVDRLGVLHAALATMKKEADTLRTELEDAGLDNIDGQLYRVNFAQCAGRTLTDWKTIAERLKASRQLIAAHTTTGEPSTRMTVKARQTH